MKNKNLQKRFKRLVWLFTAMMMLVSIAVIGFTATTVSAAGVDYPAVLARISIYDNSRNLNITGTADKSPVNTWPTNGGMNENWRFDYAGADGNGSYYRIVNQGSGRLLTPMLYSTDEGTDIVIYGQTDEKAQLWYVTSVQKDKQGNDLYYKITNCADSNMALTYFGEDKIRLSNYADLSAQKWLLNASGLQGFAGYCKTPKGDIKASTIGGMLGRTVEVSTFDELKNACTSKEPLTIVIKNKISGKTGSSNYEISTGYDGGKRYYCRDNYIYLQPNKTVIGSYSANQLYNVYFRTYNEQYGPAYNVILRNIDCTHDTELNTDNIWEFAYGWNFWIDHCYMQGHAKIETSSLKSDDWDKLLNFKGTADFITISSCRFGYHEYGVLLGYPTDDEATYKQYNGTPCVTLANNFYKDTVTRAPALCRYGYFHSLNNYVYNFSMGYTVYTACDIYAENCYYDGASTKGNVICDWGKPPYLGSYAEDGSVFKNCGRTKQGQGSSSMPVYSTPCTWRPNTNYSYKALTAEQAKSTCETYSGSQTAASKMYYAAFAETGVPSASYTEAPAEPMEPEVIEPVSGNLVQELLVTDTTRKAWRIDTDVQQGDLVFGDREVVWEQIPDFFRGSEAIVTACNAKTSTGDALASFKAGADLTVWLAFDTRVEQIPAWAAGFEKSGQQMQASKDLVFDLYAKSVKAGEAVTLGANGQSAYCVNYAVLVTPAGKTVQGDVNADGKLDLLDVITLQKWLFGFGNVTDAADLNADGCVDIFDLALLKRVLLGQQAAKPVEPATEPPTEPVTEAPTEPATEAPTEPQSTYEPDGFQFSGKVYLVGDSTVCEYDDSSSKFLDRYGWGMKFAEQYNGVTVNNLALSGRSSRSFLAEQNYQTLKNSLGKGDYLFIQFGHNDEKTDEAQYPGLGTYPGLDWATLDQNGKDAQGRYSYEYLLTAYYINLAKNKGAVPVLVTPITRRGTDGKPNYQQHTAYQQGMIDLGKNYNVPVIDMTTLTTQLYTNLYNAGGANETAKLHCYTDAAHTTLDNTHLSGAGAAKISQMIAEQTRELGLTIGGNVK